MNAPLRRRAWLPLAVFALCVLGPLALAQPPRQFGPMGGQMGGAPMPGVGGAPNAGGGPNFGPPNGGMEFEKGWTCGKCKNSWTTTGTATPEKCPKCGTRFDRIENADGTTTRTASGRRSLYIGLGVVGVAIIAAIIKGIMAMSASSGSSKKKKKKKPRRPRDDDDDDY